MVVVNLTIIDRQSNQVANSNKVKVLVFIGIKRAKEYLSRVWPTWGSSPHARLNAFTMSDKAIYWNLSLSLLIGIVSGLMCIKLLMWIGFLWLIGTLLYITCTDPDWIVGFGFFIGWLSTSLRFPPRAFLLSIHIMKSIIFGYAYTVRWRSHVNLMKLAFSKYNNYYSYYLKHLRYESSRSYQPHMCFHHLCVCRDDCHFMRYCRISANSKRRENC